MLLFRSQHQTLLRVYAQTGVKILGIVIRVRLPAPETAEERGRRIRAQRQGISIPNEYSRHNFCEIQYAYQPPEEEDQGTNNNDNGEVTTSSQSDATMIVKDFVSVSKQLLSRGRVFPIAILPGQSDSGVPTFFLPDEIPNEPDAAETCVMITASLFATTILVVGCGAMLTAIWPEWSYVAHGLVALFSIAVPGCLIAKGLDVHNRRKVPGRIERRERVEIDRSTMIRAADWVGEEANVLTTRWQPISLEHARSVLADDHVRASVLRDSRQPTEYHPSSSSHDDDAACSVELSPLT